MNCVMDIGHTHKESRAWSVKDNFMRYQAVWSGNADYRFLCIFMSTITFDVCDIVDVAWSVPKPKPPE